MSLPDFCDGSDVRSRYSAAAAWGTVPAIQDERSARARSVRAWRLSIAFSGPRRRLRGSLPVSLRGIAASGGNSPKLTFIGWNERGLVGAFTNSSAVSSPGSSGASSRMWPPVMWAISAPSAVVCGSGSSARPSASATAKRPAIRPIAALST